MLFKRIGFDILSDDSTRYYFKAEDGRIYVVEETENGKWLSYYKNEHPEGMTESLFSVFRSRVLEEYAESGEVEPIEIEESI